MGLVYAASKSSRTHSGGSIRGQMYALARTGLAAGFHNRFYRERLERSLQERKDSAGSLGSGIQRQTQDTRWGELRTFD
jgi:hypothetical protein